MDEWGTRLSRFDLSFTFTLGPRLHRILKLKEKIFEKNTKSELPCFSEYVARMFMKLIWRRSQNAGGPET